MITLDRKKASERARIKVNKMKSDDYLLTPPTKLKVNVMMLPKNIYKMPLKVGSQKIKSLSIEDIYPVPKSEQSS